MSQLERNKSILRKYIPEPAVESIAQWIVHFDFKLKIKSERSSKYGDYRPPIKKLNHQITINRDMNPYAFLITLVHEIAHLTNWNKHKNNVKPHGQEWKQEFKLLMRPFMHETIFPPDVMQALVGYMQNPAASSCSDMRLTRILKKYNRQTNTLLLEQVPHNSIFKTSANRCFVKGKKLRTRYLCKELSTNREYLFSSLAEVVLS